MKKILLVILVLASFYTEAQIAFYTNGLQTFKVDTLGGITLIKKVDTIKTPTIDDVLAASSGDLVAHRTILSGAIPFTGQPFYSFGRHTVKSSYDTTILFKGEDKCSHLFVAKYKPPSGISCCVMHDAAGCPDNWYDNFEICTKCLKHIRVKETRTTEPIKDAYEEALEKLKIKQQ